MFPSLYLLMDILPIAGVDGQLDNKSQEIRNYD